MKAMLIDLDDTLLNDRSALETAFSAFFDAHRARLDGETHGNALLRWQTLSSHYWQQYERGEITFAQQRRRRVADFLRTPLSDGAADAAFEPYLQDYEAAWALFPGVAEFLAQTAEIPKAIITNGEREQQLRKIDACGLSKHVVGVLTPTQCGYWKPAPEIFHAGLGVARTTAPRLSYDRRRSAPRYPARLAVGHACAACAARHSASNVAAPAKG